MFAQKYLILLSLPTGERNIDSFLNGILLALIKKQELSNGLIAETICRRYYLCEFTEKMKFVSTLKHYWPEWYTTNLPANHRILWEWLDGKKLIMVWVLLESGIHFFEKIVPTAVNKRGNPMPTTQKCRPLSRWSVRRSHCPELPRKIVVTT